jgi:hypothetical protein
MSKRISMLDYQDGKKQDLNGKKDELYYQAILMAFKQFIDEEQKGNIYTELRLMKAIEAARTLYK